MEDSVGVDANFNSSCDETMRPNGSYEETDNVGDDLLVDLDSYLDDINDRLIISRMVNDSVIKGMVSAFTEEAAERIAQKDLEVASLKARLQRFESDACKVEKSDFSSQDSMEECVTTLRMESEKQFHMLEKNIEDIKGYRLRPRQSEIKESEKWAGVDQILNTLRNMLNTVCTEVHKMVSSSKTSPCELKEEFRGEVEPMVIPNSSRSLPVDFDVQLWEQSAEFCSSQSTNHLEKLNHLSNLREELSSISRTLSSPEIGHLSLNGSQEDSEEFDNGTIKDHFHHEVISNHTSHENGKKESKSAMPETLDTAQLMHMSKEDIIAHFRSQITKMKRNFESLLHEKTEAYFRLRRDYFKVKGPLSSLRRDKEFEAFRKRISEALLKLDNMLTENEKLPVVYENNEMICSLKNGIDTLLSENHQIRELLTNKSKEVKCLTSQVSIAADKMSHHSSAEANLLKQIRKLKGDIEDMKIEISIREVVYECNLKELIYKTKGAIQDSDIESRSVLEIYEIIFREFALDAKAMMKCDIEDSDMESIFMEEISGIIFREAVKDAEGTMNLMKMKYEEENKLRVCLEASVLESEKALSLEIEEKGKLKKEIHRFSALKEENDQLMKEKEQYDVIDQELMRLKNQASEKEIIYSENRRELNGVKSKLEEALGKNEFYKEEINKLDQKLMQTIDNLKGANEEIKMLHGIIQEKETAISSVEAKDMEHKKQAESVMASMQKLYKAADDFEGRTMEALAKTSLRWKRLKFQLDSLHQNATSSRNMELVYKQRLERRSTDLQKAEAEVDLLGDEVDALLSLLEKIYIALCHYSPVLLHYPGIMEILKLIKRELSVETAYDPKRNVETAKPI